MLRWKDQKMRRTDLTRGSHYCTTVRERLRRKAERAREKSLFLTPLTNRRGSFRVLGGIQGGEYVRGRYISFWSIGRTLLRVWVFRRNGLGLISNIDILRSKSRCLS